MTQKYARLGAVTFLPISVNIFVITLSYDFNYTPVVTGLMVLANLMLLVWEWPTLNVLVNKTPVLETQIRMEHDGLWTLVGVLLFCFTFGYRLLVNKYDIFFWLLGCVVIGLIGLILGLRNESKRRKRTL